MAKSTISESALPPRTRKLLETLGDNLRIARMRRGMTEVEMADRMMVSRQTLRRLEAGDPSVGLRILGSALHVLGLSDDLALLADPSRDQQGLVRDRTRAKARQQSNEPDPSRDLKF